MQLLDVKLRAMFEVDSSFLPHPLMSLLFQMNKQKYTASRQFKKI
jgi:hypothetical protein